MLTDPPPFPPVFFRHATVTSLTPSPSQCRLVDVVAQRSGFAKQRQELSMEVDRAERRSKELKDAWTGDRPRTGEQWW